MRQEAWQYAAVVALCAVCWTGSGALGKDWVGPPGSEAGWYGETNWTPPGAPGSGDTARINNGGIAVIGSGTANAYQLRLGDTYSGSGTLVIRSPSASLTIGYGDAYVGYSGDGTLTQSDGALQVSHGGAAYGNLYLGYNSDAVGTVNFSGGQIDTDFTYVGYYGRGVFNHRQDAPPTHNCHGELIVAYAIGSYGRYEMEWPPPVDKAVTSNLIGGFAVKCTTVGYGGEGEFWQGAGTHTCNGDLILGRDESASGLYVIRGGTLDVVGGWYEGIYYGRLQVGLSGTSTFRVIGDDASITVDGYTQNGQSRLEALIDEGGISTIHVDGDACFAPGSKLFVDFFEPGSDPFEGQVCLTVLDVGEGGMLSGSLEFAEGVDTDPADGKYWTMDFDTVGGQVRVTYTPEPATLSVLALGALAMVRGRRR